MIIREQLPLDQYLLEFARQILRENDLPERARCDTAVTLRRRLRGTNKSDLLGSFSNLQPGQWLGDGPEKIHLMDMHSFQIVKPIIRANQSAMVQARVDVTVEPTSRKPKLQGAASVGRGIYKYINNHPDYWSNNLENQINQQCQTDPGYFIHTYFDPDAPSPINIQLDEYSDLPLEKPGEWACAYCGRSGPLFREQMGQASDGTLPCFNCDHHAEIVSEPSESAEPQPVGKVEYPAGNVVQDVVSAFQIRVDETKSKNCNLRKALWFEHHFLMEEEDLQALVPYFELGTPSEWSYPLKWEHALESGTDLYHKPWNSDLMGRHPRHEVRRIYMRPEKYRHYRAPFDFDLDRGDGRIALDREGNPMLSIKAGQRLIDVKPNGFWFLVSSDRLVPVAADCDFRDEWSCGGFLNDSASFWPLPASELNELQRTANNLWTIDVQHRESGSIVTTVFDREFFSAEDFERNLSPTKEGAHIEQGDRIDAHYASIPPPAMNGAMEGISFVRSVLPDIGGVQPATVGASAPGEPYAAQRLQVQQSLGLLTPSQQSKAECKAIVVKQHLIHAQRHKPIEWFQFIGTLYGEEWKEQDIEAFLDANLELDLTVGYKEGSERPTSLIEQELKYRQFILDIAQAAEATANPKLLKPEMLSQYAEISGMNYDVENIEADKRLADSRFQKIVERFEMVGPAASVEEEAMQVQQVLQLRDFKVMPRENHDTHIEFYMDHARAQLAAKTPRFLLISCLLEMITRHEEARKVQGQTENAAQVETQAPTIAAQIAAAQAQAQQEAAKQKAELEVRAQDQQARLVQEQMKLDAKAEEGDKQREHDAAVEAARLAVKTAEIHSGNGNGDGEVILSPREKIMETIDYEDLPAPAQSELLDEAGLPSGGTKAVHQATLAEKQAAAARSSNTARK